MRAELVFSRNTPRSPSRNADFCRVYAEAKRALQQIQHELMGVNPSAARSLEEGLEDTLTLHRLRVPESLRKTLRTTNPIESIFSTRFASRVAM